jgi:sodium transport system permease protein
LTRHWPVIRLIARRELRDLLRDRRTLFLIIVLPMLLYPVFALAGLAFAVSMMGQKTLVGVAGLEHLPRAVAHPEAVVGGSLLLTEADRRVNLPPLVVDGGFLPRYAESEIELGPIEIIPLPNGDEVPLQKRQVDAMVVIPPDLIQRMESGEQPTIRLLSREGDETSKLAAKRVGGILRRWQQNLKEVRFARHGLPAKFDEPVHIDDPEESKPPVARTADELRDTLVKFLPFLLVMWTMAGALHPAIDLTAGEKERGTMETLLISPAERSEIVAGKFLAVLAFSYGSALSNVFWMAGGAMVLGWFLPFPILSLGGLAWCVLLALPLAALFSAVALALGVFARSTKEGQYYLLPLFLLTLPLTLWSLAPGLKLNFGLSLVPVTGMVLLQQQLMSVAGEPVPLAYWLSTLGALAVYVLLALWWASAQFRRESVLFRDSERVNFGAWLRGLFSRRRLP